MNWIKLQWARFVDLLFYGGVTADPDWESASIAALPRNTRRFQPEDDRPTDPMIPVAPRTVVIGGEPPEGYERYDLYLTEEGNRVGLVLAGPRDDVVLRMSPDAAEELARRLGSKAASVRADYARKN